MELFLRAIYLSSALSLLYILLLYRSNPHRRLPSTTVTLTFFLGMAAVIPVSIVRLAVETGPMGTPFSAYVGAGLIEEGVKFLLMFLVIWRLRFPDVAEPMDLVIYFGILGAGFGIYEDFWYIFKSSYPSWVSGDPARFSEVFGAITVARSFPGHILFDGLAGYLIGYARFCQGRLARLAWIGGGFAIAVVTHGSFNMLATAGRILLITYIVFLIGIFLLLRRLAVERSPFRALITMLSRGGGSWTYPRPPLDYLFAEGFSWPGKAERGMFQVFPFVLSLLILYPMLVAAVYLVNQLIVWLFME